MRYLAVRGPLSPLYAVLLSAICPPLPAQDPAAGELDPAHSSAALEADVASLGKAAERFVEAFNKKDAEAIAALFAENGEMLSRDGEPVHGRDAIRERYKEIFAAEEVPRIALEASSVRLVAPGVAIEDGVVHFTTGETDAVKSVGYSATQVKDAEGSWLIASTRDQLEVTPPAEYIKTLDWLEGDWSYEGEEGVRMNLSIQRDEDGNFLLGEAHSTDAEGESQTTSIRIGWNPACSSVFWWTFDSDGGNASGQWTRNGDQWLIHTTGVTADAESTAATHKLGREGKDTIVWTASDRVMAGEVLPEARLRFVRQAPDATAEPVTGSTGAPNPENPAGEQQ